MSHMFSLFLNSEYPYFVLDCMSGTSLLTDCCEACTPTWLNVVLDNADVLVSIRPRVFVPEADDMTQLVHHNAKFITVFANRYGLGAPSTATHIRTAPGK